MKLVMMVVEVRFLLTCIGSFEEDNRYGILVITDGFFVTWQPSMFVSMLSKTVFQYSDKSV